MSDDAATIREAVEYLASRSKAMDAQDAVDTALTAVDRLVTERDEAHQWCVDEAEKHDVTKVALAKERLRVAQLEDALRFWVARSDRFEEVLPPELDYMKARGVLNESYVVGREVLSEKE